MNGRFKIYLRKRQNIYTFPGDTLPTNVTVQCNPSTGYSEYVPGTVDTTWYDYTDYIEEAETLSLTWDKVNSGDSSKVETNKDGSNYDKGISSDLIFFDAAYQFIYDWLLTSECQILNAVEVKIVDLIAGGTYRIFEIKNDNIDWMPIDEPCKFLIKLREQDEVWHCVHKTFIWDNWQNWFKDDSEKEHPCFLTCIEPRPRLLGSARMSLMLFFYSNPLVALLNWITGGDIKDDARRIMNANRFVDAPLVRTYIQNVAGKCGLEVDTIFDIGQEWENLCLYYPQAGYMHESDSDSVASPSLAYHFDNRWMITIAELLDKLKVLFAAEWYVTPGNTILFKHIKDLVNLAAIYDFTAPGAEPIYALHYKFNGDKKPAYGRYQYQDDGSDLASQEMSTLYSDIVDYDGPAYNPMLEGEKSKNFEFAPTGFIRDGRSKDYLDAIIRDGRTGGMILVGLFYVVLWIIGWSAPFTAGSIIQGAIQITIWISILREKANNLLDEFVNGPIYTGAVRLTSEQTMMPRVILWDGVSMQRAKAITSVVLPTPNPYYNPDLIAYDIKNKINEHNDNHDKIVYNYPCYFDGDFTGNLFDKYHDVVDNPLKSKESHQDFQFYVDLCENMLNVLGVFQGQSIQIGKVIKIETRNNYDIYGRIGNVQVDYGDNKITIKGKVLRR